MESESENGIFYLYFYPNGNYGLNYGTKNAKSPVKNVSKSKFKNRATRCTLINNQTPILKISELWHLRSWLGRRHGEKTNQGSKIRTGPLYYSIVGTVKRAISKILNANPN